nr:unnamed protein product [Spirometra erinaceieuropaei]
MLRPENVSISNIGYDLCILDTARIITIGGFSTHNYRKLTENCVAAADIEKAFSVVSRNSALDGRYRGSRHLWL